MNSILTAHEINIFESWNSFQGNSRKYDIRIGWDVIKRGDAVPWLKIKYITPLQSIICFWFMLHNAIIKNIDIKWNMIIM